MSSKRFPFNTSIEVGDDEIELSVIYEAWPVVPATYWQPAEGGEVEIVSVRHAGQPFDLTDAQEQALIEECQGRMADDFAEDAAAEADWRYQEYRDRLLMGDQP